ncbi:TetR/AcrR family transcriptional regulator [Paenibacillus thiaminolyticus]|uniref:TetR/AcrR family transcriptional regulator n=1 Tax=Paenibacillus thiaminolyticus TaxID=49283 RepID=A0AAP9J1Q2_PANTH|nr:TetR/AcrR family transcriptional regulator [Paenibacillus thiaminolyticus]MCY9538985.1 TetR/AcrR family transcriptional regulator [Paenibacillus thiaminolyticus]MCY9604229.1 TetR/AcrR family transcriptional regulator [Paenibacillus thiaminolyticus]MCY9608096.1 TetR/AcrR family transcriptional regulator [Paenibacillus thiaminolyticus]MCY9612935.1 TetR/AcrR family transcriptional regulator [Paenibacillus thiaminolyticus]MCY9622011.1 TetR/AcrR family transcriptional regulator [Paenibacillus th
MRVVKKADERRNEILDAADELFGQKGFDGTSTNDILERVGIARGTLYHHFKSKEDIMDALIERYSVRLLGAAQESAADKSIPVVERIIRVVMALNISSGSSSKEIMEHIHKPQNALMHQKIQRVIINGVTPILTGIIREGIEQGLFSTPFPYECMEMVVTYANTVFDDDMVQMTNEERASRMQAFVFNAERLLGAQSGSLMNVMHGKGIGHGTRN